MGVHEALVYLGLAEEKQQQAQGGYDTPTREIRLDEPITRTEQAQARRGEVTPIKRERPVAPAPRQESAMTELSRISTVHPAAYNDAKSIGEAFREGVPVIMNLTDMDDSDAKRLVDFSAGLVFGLRGSIERVTAKVFLLTPAHVEVTTSSAPAPKAAKSASFYNQS